MRACEVEGCGRRHLAGGWCAMHYRRWQAHGDLADPVVRDPDQRFADLCAYDGAHLLWLGNTTPEGYGRFWLDGRTTSAHHFLLDEPVQEGWQVDHLCRVTRCVLPEHLEVVTPQTNTLRQPRHAERTHCVNGHPYDGNRGASRRCKVCHTERMRRARAG